MKLKKYKHINLFEIWDVDGAGGLIRYLESQNDEMLRVLAYQYDVDLNIKDKHEIIRGILLSLEHVMNIGYVFAKHPKIEIARYYK